MIARNPDGIANALNTVENAKKFLELVAEELKASGLNATERVKNGHDIPSGVHDIIGIWTSGDSKMERYDAVGSAGAGDQTIARAVTADFAGHIPLNCVY